jgi:hypothetical protein
MTTWPNGPPRGVQRDERGNPLQALGSREDGLASRTTYNDRSSASLRLELRVGKRVVWGGLLLARDDGRICFHCLRADQHGETRRPRRVSAEAPVPYRSFPEVRRYLDLRHEDGWSRACLERRSESPSGGRRRERTRWGSDMRVNRPRSTPCGYGTQRAQAPQPTNQDGARSDCYERLRVRVSPVLQACIAKQKYCSGSVCPCASDRVRRADRLRPPYPGGSRCFSIRTC